MMGMMRPNTAMRDTGLFFISSAHITSVSYTHLDVYKRQIMYRSAQYAAKYGVVNKRKTDDGSEEEAKDERCV